MNTPETITTAIQSNDIEKMLIAYQEYTEDTSATSDDLFIFLSHPTSEREEFLHKRCNCDYQVQEQIVSPNYQVK